MKNLLIIVLLLFCTNFATLAEDSSQVPIADAKVAAMSQWLQAHPDKAKELQEILPKSQNPEADLQRWLDANPDCARQLQNAVMPEGQ